MPVTGQQFQNSIGGAHSKRLAWSVGPHNAGGAGGGPAAALLYQQLLRQAGLWSFVDVFRWLSLLCFVCVGVVWLFKRVKPGHAPAGAH